MLDWQLNVARKGTFMPTRKPAEVKAEFDRLGISAAEWARRNKLNPFTVHQVLCGQMKGRRGEAHRAAVLLGLKDGALVEPDQIASALGNKHQTSANRSAAK